VNSTTKTQVAIIGAGPTGLSLACQLVRHGIDFVIVDKNQGLTPYSKAIGVQARTLEIYEQIDLAQKAVEGGAIAGKVRMLEGGEMRAELDFSNIGHGLSSYPYMLLLEQSKNEKLLYEYLQNHGREVRWNTSFESLTQTKGGVRANLKTDGGGSDVIEARYLGGCDGAKSLVRHAAGLAFEGSTLERMFFVADVQVDWKFSHDSLHVCLARASLLALFPLKGDKRYRIVGTFPEQFAKDEGDVLFEEIEKQIKQDAQIELDIHDVEWFSTYKVHTRHVNRFSAGKCFLAGDSAHIHTPAGGQGMNTGIQDGYNLAWKLALVLKGRAGEKILETYNEERLENAKNLTRTTDRMFQFLASPEWLIAFLRTNVIPPVASFLVSLDAVRNFVFPLISQIGINYRHSSLSQHAGDEDFTVKAGDRMPYFLVDGKSIYDRLREPKFHLLVFPAGSESSDRQNDSSSLTAELESQYPGLLDFNTVPVDGKVTELFGQDKTFVVLLRPDNYIGFLSTETSLNGLRLYLKDLIEHAA
jgi:2-polyprenyl-6-methoxyphenol hydroxylase-like FAD-dependent oxidoreductase